MIGPSQSSVDAQQSSIFLLTCSDYRLTGLPFENTLRERLNSFLPTYEVRVPGGGLVLADPTSLEAQATLANFKLLSGATRFSCALLVSHANCAYHKLKYPREASGTAQSEALSQRALLEIARQVLAPVAGTAIVESFFFPIEAISSARPVTTPQTTPATQRPPPTPDAATQMAGIIRPERPDALPISDVGPAEPMSADPEVTALERARMESNTQEFLDWLQLEGRAVSELEQRQLGSLFLKNQNRARLSRRDVRQVLNDLTRG